MYVLHLLSSSTVSQLFLKKILRKDEDTRVLGLRGLKKEKETEKFDLNVFVRQESVYLYQRSDPKCQTEIEDLSRLGHTILRRRKRRHDRRRGISTSRKGTSCHL